MKNLYDFVFGTLGGGIPVFVSVLGLPVPGGLYERFVPDVAKKALMQRQLKRMCKGKA